MDIPRGKLYFDWGEVVNKKQKCLVHGHFCFFVMYGLYEKLPPSKPFLNEKDFCFLVGIKGFLQV